MRKVLSIFLCLFLLGCAANGSKTTSARGIYSNNKYGISFKIPTGWKEKKTWGYDAGFISGPGSIFIKIGKIRIKNDPVKAEKLIQSMREKVPDIINKIRNDKNTVSFRYRVQEKEIKEFPSLVSRSSYFLKQGHQSIGELSYEYLVPMLDRSKLFNLYFIFQITGKASEAQAKKFRYEFNELIDSFLSHYK